jgi:hypothetical protein
VRSNNHASTHWQTTTTDVPVPPVARADSPHPANFSDCEESLSNVNADGIDEALDHETKHILNACLAPTTRRSYEDTIVRLICHLFDKKSEHPGIIKDYFLH